MPDDVQQALLRDLLDSARAIQRYLAGVNRDAFLANPEKQDAVLRRFEILGEVASRISPATQALFPEAPFAPCAACATSSLTITAKWTSISSGNPPSTTFPLLSPS
jgi:uncharacterized protein with HEPN domain